MPSQESDWTKGILDGLQKGEKECIKSRARDAAGQGKMGEKKKRGWRKSVRRIKKERGEKRTREEEKEENKTGGVKRRCESFVSVEVFEIS